MILLGLTGSIGMGKSTVAAMFAAEDVPVFDADAEVHRLQGPGGELVEAIEQLFPGTTGPDGVGRARLSQAVLGDREKLRALEGLIHPAVGLNRAAFLEEHSEARLVLLDIPLLYEKTGAAGLDAVIVVSAPAAIQRERVLQRPNMSVKRFEYILGLQMPDAEKRAHADFIIDTAISLEETRTQVAALVTCLRAHDVRYYKQCVK